MNRTDVVSELLKALRYRYELSERALVHHAKLSADAMVGEALQLWYEDFWVAAASQKYPKSRIRRADVFVEIRAEADRKHGRPAVRAIDRSASASLSEIFLSRGDDGVLEHLTELSRGGGASRRLRSASALAGDLLNRRLFRMAGRASRANTPAQKLFDSFGSREARARLQHEAEQYAELTGSGPQVAIWLPNPKMRLKLAEVLVDYGGAIDSFVEYERNASGRGSEIYDAHSRLWGVWIFINRDVTPEDELVVLAFLAQRMGISWEQRDGVLGTDPDLAPDHLAAHRSHPSGRLEDELEDLVEKVRASQARGLTGTFSELELMYRAAREKP